MSQSSKPSLNTTGLRVMTKPNMSLAAASSVVVIGDGFLLLGIVVALAGGIRFYLMNGYSPRLARWGALLGAPGAAIVLVGTVAEVSPGDSRLKPVELIVLCGAVLVVVELLIFPCLPRRLHDSSRNTFSKIQKTRPDNATGLRFSAGVNTRATIRPKQDSDNAGQLAQSHAESGQPR
jgi:4-amino-4-deoxy-L-arabinose transferase-like glycosyltransferase